MQTKEQLLKKTDANLFLTDENKTLLKNAIQAASDADLQVYADLLGREAEVFKQIFQSIAEKQLAGDGAADFVNTIKESLKGSKQRINEAKEGVEKEDDEASAEALLEQM